jgi:phosphatidylserine decarboxylase
LLHFFRDPVRSIPLKDDQAIYSPADGKVVVIEETFEPEYLKSKCIQISIFMSPLNVHANRYPISGQVDYMKYHKGKYLFAWHPKSSTENERTSLAIKNKKGTVFMRQVAGIMARRIVCYAKQDTQVIQGDELGFIKLGSRADIYLPLDSKINVTLEQKVKAGIDIIAEIQA